MDMPVMAELPMGMSFIRALSIEAMLRGVLAEVPFLAALATSSLIGMKPLDLRPMEVLPADEMLTAELLNDTLQSVTAVVVVTVDPFGAFVVEERGSVSSADGGVSMKGVDLVFDFEVFAGIFVAAVDLNVFVVVRSCCIETDLEVGAG